jgi:hypothetical protein
MWDESSENAQFPITTATTCPLTCCVTISVAGDMERISSFRFQCIVSILWYWCCLCGCQLWEARGSVLGWVAGSNPDEIIGFFNWPTPSIRTIALGSTQPLREMSTRNLPEGKERPARKAKNLTATCELAVYKMWKPRRLTVVRTSRALLR